MIPFSKEMIRVHKINDYAFVHFTTRPFAEKAMQIISGKRFSRHFYTNYYSQYHSCREDHLWKSN